MRPIEMAMRALVALAKRNLADANKAREHKNDWPAGQKWGDLGHSSQCSFMRAARAEAGVDHDAYKAAIEEALMNPPADEDLDAVWEEMEKPNPTADHRPTGEGEQA